MSSHTLLHTTIRLLAVLSIIHDAQSLHCYKCESGEWKKSQDCESPTMNTFKARTCEKCYTVYRKDVVSTSDTLLIRGCYSKGDSSLSKYNEKNYKIQQCSENLCNGETFNSHNLEKMQGMMDDTGNKELAEKVPKSCYKCTSYDGKECNIVNEQETLTATDCQNKLCTTIYSKEKKAVLRDCYTWRKVQYLVDKGLKDWTVAWCTNSKCNNIAANQFPHCVKGTLKKVVDHGCVEIGLPKLQEAVPETAKVTTAKSSSAAATIKATGKITEADTTSEMTATKMTKEKDKDAASRFMAGSPVLICFILTKILLW